jgi:hypothetical protein
MITEHISSERRREIAIHNDLISTIEEFEIGRPETIIALLPWSALFWLLVTVAALRSPVESERRRSIETQTSLDVHIHECECHRCARDVEVAA